MNQKPAKKFTSQSMSQPIKKANQKAKKASQKGTQKPVKVKSQTARHTMHPPMPCLGRTFLMFNSRKPRRRSVAERPLADFGAAPPRGRLVRSPGGLRPKVRVRDEKIWPKPVQLARSRDIRGMNGKRASASFFTERSLATHLAVSDRTIRNWIRPGELPSYKLGACRRIDPADVETFLARHRDETA